MNTRGREISGNPGRRDALPALALAALLALPVGLIAAPSAWGGPGECLRAEIAEPMRLPGGALLPAGNLRLCRTELSPAQSLHRTYLDGSPAAMLLSLSAPREGVATGGPAILFRRAGDGRLELIGCSASGGDEPAFRFVPHGPVRPHVTVSEPRIIVAAVVN